MNLGVAHVPRLGAPPELLRREDVATLLGLPLRKLTWWVYALDPVKQYRRFEIARHDGSRPREIRAPIKPIKDIQRTLATKLLEWYDPPPAVHGFALGRSPLSNARVHQRQEWVLRLDIRDFFPSINFGRVYGLFKAFPFEYPTDVAALLAQICCYQNELPQGAPTSPIVSNLICRSLDAELARIARAERCYYSRYADDLCFSTQRRQFPENLAFIDSAGSTQVGQIILDAVNSNGFDVQARKTRLMRRTQRQRVTGLVVNEIANVDRRYVRNLRNLLFIWRLHGVEVAKKCFAETNPRLNWPPNKNAATFELVIRGRVQHVGSVKGWTSPIYQALARKLQALDPTFTPTTLRALERPTTVRVFTEGESDALHLLAAKDYFDQQGEFQNIRLEFPADAARGGSSELLAHCKALAVTAQPSPCVCLFDRDEPGIVRDAVGGGDMKDFGNNVMAVALGAPSWRDAAAPLCIELLYQDADLKQRGEDGRRIYLSSEFDPRSGQHDFEPVNIVNPRQKGLIREEVFGAGRASVGMTKMKFANSVRSHTAPFHAVGFEGFRPTFKLIEEAVARFSTTAQTA